MCEPAFCRMNFIRTNTQTVLTSGHLHQLISIYSMNDAAPIFLKHCVVITSVSKEVCQKSVKRDYWRIAPEEIRVFIIDVSRYLEFLLCLDFPIYLINVTFDQHRPTCTLYQYVSVESTDECDPVWSIFSIHWKKVAFFRARILTALKC